MRFVFELENRFRLEQNPKNALAMAQYMKNHFCFLGIKTPERRAVFKLICQKNQIEIATNARAIGLELFLKKEREFHYCGIEILSANLKNKFALGDIVWIEKMLVTHSWWDSVDTISKFILGNYLQQFPSEVEAVVERFSNSENPWLNRSVLLFQLGYKSKTNFELLCSLCKKHACSDQFFIKKAIGWALREYAKTNPKAVRDFVLQTNLKPLSKKEALKNI